MSLLLPEHSLSGLRILAGLDPGIAWKASLVGALGYAVLSSRKLGLDSRSTYWAGLIGLAFGMWGGHLLGIYYYGMGGHSWAWFRFWTGGQAEYGGLVAGTLAAIVLLRLRGLAVSLYADAMAPAMALGVAVGRIGCFLNGDDFGKVSHLPWAVRFLPGTEAYADHVARGWITPNAAYSLPVHPVQIYCSLFWLGLFVVLLSVPAGLSGRRFGVLMVGHGAGRLIEQSFRGDFQTLVGAFSLTQLISFAVIAGGFVILLGSMRKAPPIPMKANQTVPLSAEFGDEAIAS